MNFQRPFLVSVVLATLALSLPLTSEASMASYRNFKKQYPSFKAMACTICHDGEAPRLNAYGVDLQKAGQAFVAIEDLDSDGDGVKNGDEIRANTLPGDKTSVPGAQ